MLHGLPYKPEIRNSQPVGGMYSYDWLENTLGPNIHSAREMPDNWQQLQVDDLVTLIRPGWMGL